jgi:hypothetical protein
MKKFLIVLAMAFTIACVNILNAQSVNKVGTTAAQFLKIGIGARAIGMGGAFSTMGGDINSIYWNPAGIAKINDREATFDHVDWIMDVNNEFAAFVMSIPDFGTVGGFVTVLTMGDMPVRTVDEPLGTGENFSAGSFSGGLSYARNLTDNFALGLNVKYVHDYIWHESANSFAIDIGALYSIPILNEFRIGASISNFGSKMKLDGIDIQQITTVGAGLGNQLNSNLEVEEYDLPLTMRIGVAADVIKLENHRLTVAVDAVHPNDNLEYVNAGAEYGWNDLVFIRGGYKTMFLKDSEEGLTLGFGLNYRLLDALKVQVDYAYEDFGRLKNVHYLSIGVKF